LFWFLRAILGARFLAVLDGCAVEGSANDVVANAGKVFYPTAANEYNAVLLEVMSFARDVRDDFLSV
jgi:hypothetical protein